MVETLSLIEIVFINYLWMFLCPENSTLNMAKMSTFKEVMNYLTHFVSGPDNLL